MPGEFDRRLIPELFQGAPTILLGASCKGLEMVKTPRDSLDRMWREMKPLVSIPGDAGEGIQNKARALAAVWMEKDATLMEEFKSAGENFTEDAKEGK